MHRSNEPAAGRPLKSIEQSDGYSTFVWILLCLKNFFQNYWAKTRQKDDEVQVVVYTAPCLILHLSTRCRQLESQGHSWSALTSNRETISFCKVK